MGADETIEAAAQRWRLAIGRRKGALGRAGEVTRHGPTDPGGMPTQAATAPPCDAESTAVDSTQIARTIALRLMIHSLPTLISKSFDPRLVRNRVPTTCRFAHSPAAFLGIADNPLM